MTFERFSTAGRAVLAHAESEARALGHLHIGAEHLLLALTAPPAGAVTPVTGLLAAHGVDADDVRATVVAAAVRRSSAPVLGVIPFAPRTKKILEMAVQEAGGSANGWTQVQPEHLVLAILREGDSVACAVLSRHRVKPAAVRALLNSAAADAQPGPEPAALRGPLTAGARRAAELARNHAGDGELGTQHLLLALLDETDGVAARVLAQLGVEAGAVRDAVAAAATTGTSDGDPVAAKVTLGEGVDVHINDAALAARLAGADRDEVGEIVRRAIEEHLAGRSS